MSWLFRALDLLAAQPVCGYDSSGSAASEPTALAALALAAHGYSRQAQEAARWLAYLQADDGSVGVRAGELTPAWPTSLAVLVWTGPTETGCLLPEGEARDRIRRAIDWIVSIRAQALEQVPEFGHNTRLAAWPWVPGTHGWIEPTALAVKALKAAEHRDHPRTREAVRMLIDRQLPGGGCNYGNTQVLGQDLRPHVQPTGLALWALAGEEDFSGRIERSLVYLKQKLNGQTTTASLAWGVLGLSAHRRCPAAANSWLAAAAERTLARGASGYKLALAVLAAGRDLD